MIVMGGGGGGGGCGRGGESVCEREMGKENEKLRATCVWLYVVCMLVQLFDIFFMHLFCIIVIYVIYIIMLHVYRCIKC